MAKKLINKIKQAAIEAGAHIRAMDLEQFYGDRAAWADASVEEQRRWEQAKDYIAGFIEDSF